MFAGSRRHGYRARAVPPTFSPKFGALIDTRLRVVTWNLWGRGGPWEARLAGSPPRSSRRVRTWSRSRRCGQRSGGRNQAAVLAEALGFHHVWASRFAIDGVAVGNAILSRWPIVESEIRPLPARPELEELRNVVRASVDGPRGRLAIYTTHLNWRFDQSDVRQEQVRYVARFIAESRDGRVPADPHRRLQRRAGFGRGPHAHRPHGPGDARPRVSRRLGGRGRRRSRASRGRMPTRGRGRTSSPIAASTTSSRLARKGRRGPRDGVPADRAGDRRGVSVRSPRSARGAALLTRSGQKVPSTDPTGLRVRGPGCVRAASSARYRPWRSARCFSTFSSVR